MGRGCYLSLKFVITIIEEIYRKGGNMEKDRIYFLVSIPEGFKDKFVSFLRNLNTVNINGNPPVVIESVYGKKKFAVIPKTEEKINVGTRKE